MKKKILFTLLVLTSCNPLIISATTESPITTSAESTRNQISPTIFPALEDRIKSFENTLRFEIKILEVGFIEKFEGGSRYSITVEEIITNISNKPIVVRRKLNSCFTDNNMDADWKIFYDKRELNYFDGTRSPLILTRDDFLLIEPNEFQKCSFVFTLPMKLMNSSGEELSLSGKKINFVASYNNSQIGFDEDEHDYSVDLNAWVGNVQSDSAGYVFP